MRNILRAGAALFLLLAVVGLGAAQGKPGTLVCVGLYSETSDGSISYRVGAGDWIVVKVGDTIPAGASIRVNVDRDWIELTPGTNRNAVYEIHGPDTGEVVKKVTDIVAEIAAASREQSTGIEQVNRAVAQMDETTQQNASLVEEAASSSRAIVDRMRALDALISRYQLDEETGQTQVVAAPRASSGAERRSRAA